MIDDRTIGSIQPRLRRRRWRRGAGVVVGIVAGSIVFLGSTGCDSIGSDIGAIFGDIAPPSPRQAAEWALDPFDAENRRRGTTLLANAPWGGSDVYLAMYRDRVESETDPQVLAISIRALARWGIAEDGILIAPHLVHPSREVRWDAARGLQRLHDPRVIPALTRRLADVDEDPGVRTEVAIALGQYPQDSVFQVLVAALDARELGINMAAHDSLRLLTGVDFGLDRAAWLNWYEAASEPFAGQEPFLFPTFSRRVNLGDRLVFWRPLVFESPAPPAGLRDDGARGTYDLPEDAGQGSVGGQVPQPRGTYDREDAEVDGR